MTTQSSSYTPSTQDTTMTLTEIAQTFPPMHRWSREQQQTVAKAINAIIGQTFICNHPNMQGVETTVVEQHPHSSGCTLELHSPSRETHQNHSCDVFHFVENYTPKTQDDPMPIQMTATQFFRLFATQDDAIDFIVASNEKGLVEVSENTLPCYTFRNGRFVAYSDWQPNTHSFDVRIERWYEDEECSSDAVVRFDYTDGIDVYWNYLHHELDGVTDESEMHWQDNPQTHRLRERDALALQIAINNRRLNRTRTYLIAQGATITPNEFEQHCVRVAEMRDLNDKAFNRIEELGY